MAKIFDISDFSAPELDVYARLTENQLVNRADPANALFIAESPLVIGRALDAGCVPVSFLMERRHVDGKAREILARCPADIPVYAAELDVLTQLTGFHLTRGMLCAMRRPALPEVAVLCANAARVAVLENVMNPTNIGAIFRSAAALGVDAVLLTSAGSDPLYRRAVRVSMGTVFQVPWTYLPEDGDWQQTLHALGFQTAAMALRDDSLRIDDINLKSNRFLSLDHSNKNGHQLNLLVNSSNSDSRIPFYCFYLHKDNESPLKGCSLSSPNNVNQLLKTDKKPKVDDVLKISFPWHKMFCNQRCRKLSLPSKLLLNLKNLGFDNVTLLNKEEISDIKNFLNNDSDTYDVEEYPFSSSPDRVTIIRENKEYD